MTPLRVLIKRGYTIEYPLPELPKKFQVRAPKHEATVKIAAKLRLSGAQVIQGCVISPWRPWCDKPVEIFRSTPGYPGKKPVEVLMWVKCRKCEKCLKAKRAHWSRAGISESNGAVRTWAVRLSFSPVHLAGILAVSHGTSNQGKALEAAAYRHVSKFLKRVRKNSRCKLRFLAVAEYGGKNGRLHYHLLIHEYGRPLLKRVIEAAWPSHSHSRLVVSQRQVVYVCKYLTKDSSSRIRASRGYGYGLTVSSPGKAKEQKKTPPGKGADFRSKQTECFNGGTSLPHDSQSGGTKNVVSHMENDTRLSRKYQFKLGF